MEACPPVPILFRHGLGSRIVIWISRAMKFSSAHYKVRDDIKGNLDLGLGSNKDNTFPGSGKYGMTWLCIFSKFCFTNVTSC